MLYMSLGLAAAVAAFLYGASFPVFIGQAAGAFIFDVAFPAVAIFAGLLTYFATHGKLVGALFAGISCALVLELFATYAVAVGGSVP